VWACSLGDVGEGVEHGTVAGDLKGFHRGWVGLIGWWILSDSCSRVSRGLGIEGQRGGEESSNDKELT
jgi:hypothetical protein